MRVLTVGNGYPPHHHGGYELIWESAVDHLREKGHEVGVLTTNTLTDATEPDPPGVRRTLRWDLKGGEFKAPGLLGRAATARHNHRELERQLDQLRPDVVSWWSMGGLSLTMLETVRRRGIPAVAFVLDEWPDYGRWADAWLHTFTGPRRGRLAPLASRLAGVPASVDLGAASRYVFISEFTRDAVLARGVDLPDTSVAHSGVKVEFLDPAPPRGWNWKLLYVGRIDRRKGIDTAIGSLAHLPAEANLRIVGSWDPVEEGRLRTVARDLGVEDRVEFAGKHDGAALVAAYGDADVALFPVRWNEPWGLVPIEAMGRGTPVIATGRGGSGEYLRDGENCLLFETDDESGLAEAITRLAKSPDLRAKLRAGGIATSARFTEPIYNREVEAELRAAIERSGRA
jgi:glycogen(starch) synthase